MAKPWLVVILVVVAIVALCSIGLVGTPSIRNHWSKNLELHRVETPTLQNAKPKIVIITLEDRPLIELLNIHNRSVQQYADYHGYEYRFLNNFNSPLPVYWKKLHWMQQVLEEGVSDYVLWLDSDTIIPNPRVPLSTIVDYAPSASIYIAKDYPYISISAFCAGVFLIRNNSIGRQFVADCLDSSVNNPKCLVDDKPVLNGRWAGECYEQGAMNRLIKEQYSTYTCNVPPTLITNAPTQFTNFNAVIVHCPGNKDACVKGFKAFLSQDQSLPVVKNHQPLKVCLLLTMHCLPGSIAQHSRTLQRWINETSLPIYIVDSAGENALAMDNPRVHYYCFKQRVPEVQQHSSVVERDRIIRAAEHFALELSQYDLVCKVTGSYFLKQLESTLSCVPAGTDVVLQFNRHTHGELFAMRPSLLIPLALRVRSHHSWEKELESMASEEGLTVKRFPPFKLESDIQRSSGDTINYL